MASLYTDNLAVRRMTKGKLPSLPFAHMKKKILGAAYDLSITFVHRDTMTSLSKTYKGDPTHKNILSFPLEKTHGEIILNLETVRREAPRFEKTYHEYLGFLVIHGMLHLKGYTHGSKMESEEKKFVKMFHL